MLTQKVTIGNVCFIQNPSKDRLLLLKRNREPLKGLWTGVGGKVEFFEDIRESVVREVQEETGLSVVHLKCAGILKTILEGTHSSWILFIYTAVAESELTIRCDEGELKWVLMNQLFSFPLIGFIKEVLSSVLSGQFVEGTVRHDASGHVLEKSLSIDDR